MRGRMLRAALGLGLGAAFGLVAFVVIWGVTGYVAGPIWGAPLFLLYSLAFGSLAGATAALITGLPASMLTRQVITLLAGGLVGTALGLGLGTWVRHTFESDPDLYFSIFQTEPAGQPVASVDIVIVTALVGMVFAALVGTRWYLRPVVDMQADLGRASPANQVPDGRADEPTEESEHDSA